MPPAAFKQATFGAGIVSPELYSRLDVPRVQLGCRTVDNFIIGITGAARNRQGSEYIASTKGDAAARLVPFVFNEEQSYVVELGAGYLRLFRSGAQILDPGGTHEGGTHATIFTDLSRSWVEDALVGVVITNVTDGSTGTVTANTSNTVTVSSLAGGTDDDFDDGDVVTIPAPYEVVTPWAAADIGLLKYAQANDITTITHRGRAFPPYELKRLADDNWTLTAFTVVRPINPPTGITLTNAFDTADPTHPDKLWDWVATSVDANGIESLPSVKYSSTVAVLYPDSTLPEFSITAPTVGNTAVSYNWYRGNDGVYGFVGSSKNLTFVDPGHVPDLFDGPPEETDPFAKITTQEEASEGGEITLLPDPTVAIKAAAAEANDETYTYSYTVELAIGDTLTFNLESRPTGGGAWTNHQTYVMSNDTMKDREFTVEKGIVISGAIALHEFQINQTAGTGSAALNFIRYTTEPTAGVDEEVDNYPASVAYYEQRQVFASLARNRQQIVTTRSGDFHNFDRSAITRDDDSVDLTIASTRLDEIRSMLHLEALWLFTAGGIWRLAGVEGERLTPSSFDLNKVVHYGASWVDPVIAGPTALYQTDRGRKVRELVDHPESPGTRDLSALAPHLLRKQKITEWMYADDPDSCVWAVRDDGVLLGLTYSIEHDIWAWHQHSTLGTYESVCVVPEAEIDAVYVIVKRTINAVTKRYVERFDERWTDEDDIEDAVFLDSAISYDGRHVGAILLQITGGPPWDAGDDMTINSDTASTFVAGDVGDHVHIRFGTTEYRFEITAFTDSQNVTGRLQEGTVDAAHQATTSNDWGFARLAFTGAGHLEAANVSVLGDGAEQKDLTVASGTLTLDTHAERVVAGLPYVSDLEPLLNIHGRAGQMRARQKLIGHVGVEVDQWRGLYLGDVAANLRAIQERDIAVDWDITQQGSELIYFKPKSGWTRTPAFLIRQSSPLPVTILSVVPDVLREENS